MLLQVGSAAWASQREWLGQPLLDGPDWAMRLRHYAVFLLLIGLISPFSHAYLAIPLSLGELAVHTAMVLAAVGVTVLLIESAAVVLARIRGRGHAMSSGGFLLRAAAAYVVSSSVIGIIHSTSPFTQSIMEKHAEATRAAVFWEILPFALLVVYGMYQAMHKGRLAREVRDLQRLNEELTAARRRRGAGRQDITPSSPSTFFAVQSDGLEIPLRAESVVRVQADQNYCHVLVDTETDTPRRHMVRMTLADALRRLPQQLFLQTHRSHLVNLRYVTGFNRAGRRRELRLHNGERIPVSRTRVGFVQAKIAEFLAASGSAAARQR